MSTKNFRRNSILQSLLVVILMWFSHGFSIDNSDKLIAAIENAIKRYYVTYNPIDISINNGTVTLRGKINSLQGKYRIYEYVSSVPGVKSISNELEVNSRVLDNEMLVQKLAERLAAVRSITNPGAIKISADNGVVTLAGDVLYYREKLILNNFFSHQLGVRDIINDLKVTQPDVKITDQQLTTELTDIIENLFYGENRIEFEVNKGIIKIKGQVHTLLVKEKVETEFLRVVGVRQVVNNLNIDDYK